MLSVDVRTDAITDRSLVYLGGVMHMNLASFELTISRVNDHFVQHKATTLHHNIIPRIDEGTDPYQPLRRFAYTTIGCVLSLSA